MPLIEKDIAIAGLDNGHLVALTLQDGKVLWDKTIASGRGRTEIDRMVDIDGAVSVDKGVIYVAGYQGRVAAVNLENGRFLWARDGSSVQGLAVNASAVFYTDQDGTVWALDKQSGATLWKQDALLHRNLSTPVSFQDQLVVVDFDGYMHWLSTEDGHFIARDRVDKSASWLSSSNGEQTVYLLTNTGELSAWRIQ